MALLAVAYVFPDNPDDEAVAEAGRFLIADQARQQGLDPTGLVVRRTYDERHVVAWVGGDGFPTSVPEALMLAMRIVIPPGSAHVRIVRWQASTPGETPAQGIDLRDVRPVMAASPRQRPPEAARSADYT